MSNANKPAFPISEEQTDRVDDGINIYTGLTKREYFAAMAMQGILAANESDFLVSLIFETLGIENTKTKYAHREHYPAFVSRLSARYADALLKELEKEAEP